MHFIPRLQTLARRHAMPVSKPDAPPAPVCTLARLPDEILLKIVGILPPLAHANMLQATATATNTPAPPEPQAPPVCAPLQPGNLGNLDNIVRDRLIVRQTLNRLQTPAPWVDAWTASTVETVDPGSEGPLAYIEQRSRLLRACATAPIRGELPAELGNFWPWVSPDGRHVLLTCDLFTQQQNLHLALLDFSGPNVRAPLLEQKPPLAAGGNVTAACFSPKGDIAYIATSQARILAVACPSLLTHQTIDHGAGHDSHAKHALAISPDGRFLAFARNRRHGLFLYDLLLSTSKPQATVHRTRFDIPCEPLKDMPPLVFFRGGGAALFNLLIFGTDAETTILHGYADGSFAKKSVRNQSKSDGIINHTPSFQTLQYRHQNGFGCIRVPTQKTNSRAVYRGLKFLGKSGRTLTADRKWLYAFGVNREPASHVKLFQDIQFIKMSGEPPATVHAPTLPFPHAMAVRAVPSPTQEHVAVFYGATPRHPPVLSLVHLHGDFPQSHELQTNPSDYTFETAFWPDSRLLFAMTETGYAIHLVPSVDPA